VFEEKWKGTSTKAQVDKISSRRKESRQADLRSLVGMESNVQMESEDDRMASETSAEEAGRK
jgi:hypothetical protein